MMASGVVLHHDKALPHMAEVAIEIIWKLKFELLLPPSIQLRSHPILLPYFWTAQKCATWIPVCKQEIKDMVDQGLWDCDSLYCCGRIPTFQRSMLPSSSPQHFRAS
jgi:hypothetical protein